MLIQDLITRAPVTVGSGASLASAAARMREAGVGSVVVTEEAVPVGVVTDRDVALALAEGLEGAVVGDIMTPAPVCVACDADVETALERMEAHGVRRLLVLEDARLIGVVSLDDVFVHLGYLMRKAAALVRSEIGVRLL